MEIEIAVNVTPYCCVGLDSCCVINLVTGKFSFGGRSLHHIGDTTPNPYEQAISIIGRTLSAFDEDNLIPCFGFGDGKCLLPWNANGCPCVLLTTKMFGIPASTHDQDIFSFYPNEQPCNGFQDALARYKELLPHLRLAGIYSFNYFQGRNVSLYIFQFFLNFFPV